MENSLFNFLIFLLGCGDKTSDNQVPTIAILESDSETSFLEGTSIAIQAQIGDAETSTSELSFNWLLNGEGVCTDSQGSDTGLISCTLNPPIGEHLLVLEVFDLDGGSAAESVSLTVVDGQAPSISITPLSTQRLYADIPVSLEASVQDDEDPYEALSVLWRSNIDGDLASGLIPNAEGFIQSELLLSEGVHQLEVEVIDSRGKIGNDVLSVQVSAPNTPPTCSWVTPEEGTSVGEGMEAYFQIEVADNDEDVDQLMVQWSSDIDGDLGTSTPSSNGVAQLITSELSAGQHTIQSTVTDSFGLQCISNRILRVGTAAVLTWLSPDSSDYALEGSLLEMSIQVEDEDQPVTEIALQWTSSIDGALGTTTADSSGVAILSLSTLSVGTHSIEILATDVDGLQTLLSSVVTVNSPPSEPILSLNPSSVYTTDSVEVIASGSLDPEGGSVQYQYAWYQDGVLSAASTSSILPASATSKGELWAVEVIPSDGIHDGPAGTHSFTILNSAPLLSQVLLTPASPSKQDTLQCEYAGEYDADGDSLSFSYSWTNNGTLLPVTTAELDAQYFSKGDSLSCSVTVFDGSTNGVMVTSVSEIIINAPPSVSNAHFSPLAPNSTDEINCIYDYADVDEDADNSTIEWFVNGSAAGQGNPLSSSVVQGDLLTCQVRANDGSEDGNVISSSVTIANSPPVLDMVSISPSTPVFGDTLSCVLGFTSDNDGDSSFTYVYEWLVNGNVVASTETLIGYFVGGDSVECRVTPTDGNFTGASVSDVVLIDSTPPTVSNVTTSPLSPRADDEVYCSYSYADVDNDVDQSIVTWMINGSAAGQGNPLSATIVRGDNIDCSVQAANVNSTGNSESASTTVVNDIPLVSSLLLSPLSILTDDIVSADLIVDDADNDALTFQYSWYVNGIFVASTSTIDGVSFFERGDTISVEVTPSDGFSTGSTVQSLDIVVENTPPTAPLVYVNYLAQTRVIDDLICELHSGSEDADGDSLSYTYSWTVDGIPFAGSTTTNEPNDTVSALDTLRGEIWACSISVDDGEGGITSTSSEVLIYPDLTQRIVSGNEHSCFLDEQGAIECWGRAGQPQVTNVPAGVYTEIVGAGDSNCALKEDGSIQCWGGNNYGEATPPLGEFLQLSMSAYHGCAVDVYREVHCWGRDDYGEGVPPSGPFVRVGATNHLTCGLRDDDSMECWGLNDSGPLGDPPQGTYISPGFGGNTFDTYACGVSDIGVSCWGTDTGDAPMLSTQRDHWAPPILMRLPCSSSMVRTGLLQSRK